MSDSTDAGAGSPRLEVHEHTGRVRVSSGTLWESSVGYSRAVRIGPRVWVSGTTATLPDGTIAGPGDAYAQTRQIVANLERALAALGGSLADVVRLRVYVIDQADWPAVGRALGEAFGTVRPANTLVGVAWLVDPAMRVEIDADAWLSVEPGSGAI